MPLYVCGARMLSYYPVSIPYHGNALNITVQSYAGQLDFGLTSCRRMLSQDETYEIVGYMHDAVAAIEMIIDKQAGDSVAVGRDGFDRCLRVGGNKDFGVPRGQ